MAEASRLRWGYLLLLTLFVGDVLIPDAVPFVDEILLGIGTLILGRWRRRVNEKRAGQSVG